MLTQKNRLFFFIIIIALGISEIGLLASNEKPSPAKSVLHKIEEGTILRQKGNFSSAIAVMEEALGLAKSSHDTKEQLICLINLGVLYWDQGEVKDSSGFYSEALSLSRSLGLKQYEEECLGILKIYDAYGKGKELRLAGRYQESIGHFEEAVNLARKIKSPEHELKCLRQLSISHLRLEDFQVFFMLNKEALKIARWINHRQEQGRCLNNIGLYFSQQASYSRALANFEEALLVACETNDFADLKSSCLNNIGVIYRDLGSYDKALRYIFDALKIDNDFNVDDNISIDLNNIGAIYRIRGEISSSRADFYNSLDYYLRSLAIAQKNKDLGLEIKNMNNIGLVYQTLGNYASARKYFLSALNKADSIGDYYESCNICVNLGFAYLHSGEHAHSKKFLKRSIELGLRTGRNDVLWEAHFGLGKCLEEENQFKSAMACYRRAIVIIDLIRSRLSLDEYKVGYSRDKLKVYEALINLLFKMKDDIDDLKYDREIFDVIEQGKSRSFFEALNIGGNFSKESADSQYLSAQNVISKKISQTISGLIKQGPTEEQRRALLVKLEIEEEESLGLLNRMRTEQSDDSSLEFPAPISIETIQDQILDQKTAILEFFLGEKQSYSFLITKNAFVLRTLPPRALIEDSLRAYFKVLSTPPKGEYPGFLAAKRIYRDLIHDFEDTISPAIEHIIIIPDGILYYLPFETLIRDDGEETSRPPYLIERFKISYAPSASSLALLLQRSREAGNSKLLLALGDPVYTVGKSRSSGHNKKFEEALREIYLDNGFEFSPLPFSKTEIKEISRFFPRAGVDIYLEEMAKEEVVKKLSLTDYRILHFACHGFLDEKAPLRSALVLTLDDGTEEDGFLQGREIYNLKLNADLVVLSACQTAKGKLENGEGVFGLPRVFFYAGARSTLSSLWKVNDRSTSDLMQEFYRYIANGDDKAQALRLAKMKMLSSKFSHPFYWAAFVLNGDYHTVFSR